ncbi:MAG TPA: sigma-70 family RNA polymerase sigma factor [Acidimicrobiia bacterium]|nr:sigma-70 family RNA polymerase sigma factor [Acidimicrobiia bacterium]
MSDPQATLVADVKLPSGPRASFIARRVVRAIVTDAPAVRSVDAALLVSEVVNLMYQEDVTLSVRVEEIGRRVRVTTTTTTPGALDQADAIVTKLLDRLSDGWGVADDAMWFELEMVRRHTLSHLSDEELFALVPADRDARDEIYSRYEGWAASVANRYRRGSAHADDVGQAASIALVNAIDRFDLSYGVKFTTYARKTIIGTLKRYLRDTTWSIRVPRSLSDTMVELNRAIAEMSQRLGRMPEPAELAEELGRPIHEVEDAMEAALAYNAKSVDAPISEDDETSLLRVLGSDDEQYDLADIWHSLEPLISDLGTQEQEVLFLRFFEDMTQSDIAEVVGVSQMQVSRLITRALDTLRARLTPED